MERRRQRTRDKVLLLSLSEVVSHHEDGEDGEVAREATEVSY